MSTVHGTAVARAGRGVLILGASGAGKSALALELMAMGGDLVADDAVLLQKSGAKVVMLCPASISGRIEARGVGILSVKPIAQAGLAFIVDLDKTDPSRLPKPRFQTLLGVEHRLICGKGQPGLGAVIWCLLGGGRLLLTE